MPSAILITYENEESFQEAMGLCEAAGYDIVHIIRQRFLKKPKYGIGGGVLEKLVGVTEALDPDVIIFDEILKTSQNYNLASKLNKLVLDRESLILDIFERRASTDESLLQVKLAKLVYERVHAKEKVRLTRKAEKPGFQGIGIFESDVYARDIQRRANTVRSKLIKAGKQRELHREGRRRQGFKTISLAGYTSSGKSTLFNSLTGETTEESSELFTTLNTKTRRVTIKKEPYLLSDTVGFIGKLPAYMIEAFNSTLEELLYTNAVIVVIDSSDYLEDYEHKLRTCISTLDRMGVERSKMIFALNKLDLIPYEELEEKIAMVEDFGTRKIMTISATTGENLEELKELITRTVN